MTDLTQSIQFTDNMNETTNKGKNFCLIISDLLRQLTFLTGFPGGASSKESACQYRRCREAGSISGSGRSLGGGHGNTLQYSCLENPMDRGAWKATVHEVAKTQTRLKQLSTHACTPILIYIERKEVALNGCQDISGTLVKGLQIH